MKRKCSGLMIVLWLAFPISVWGAGLDTIVSDDFEDGNRDGWFKSNDASSYELAVAEDPNLGTGKALLLTNTSTTGRFLICPFDPIVLQNPGETIQVSIDVRATTATSSTTGFRLGLMNSNGTPLIVDETGKAITDDDYGYFIRMAVAPGSGTLQIWDDPGVSTVAGGSNIAKCAETSSNYALDGNKHSFVFRVTRLADGSGMQWDLVYDGEKIIDSVSGDSDSPVTEFDEFVLASGANGVDFAVDNVVIQTETVPLVDAGPQYLIGPFSGIQLQGLTDATNPTIQWIQLDAPAEPNVVFNDPEVLDPIITVDEPGIYTLRMTVSVGNFTGYDDITVRVKPDDLIHALQAHWKFDGNSSDPDDYYYKMTSVTGTPQLVTVGSGYRCGTALELKKGDILNYGPAVGGDTSVSIAFRFKPAADVGDEGIGIISKYSSVSADPHGGWTVQYRNDADLRFRISSGWNNGTGDLKIVGSFPPGQWTHVVGTFDETTGEMNFYVNGELTDTRTTSQTSLDLVTDLKIGGENWSGLVDEVYLYDYAINAEQVYELYGACQNVPPLVNVIEEQVKAILPQDTVILHGEVADDDETTVAWSVVDNSVGAQITFGSPDALETTAQFSMPGNYTLKLTATDSEGLSNSDTVVVKIRPEDFDGLEAHITFNFTDPNSLDPNSALGSSVYYGATIGGAPGVTAGIDPNIPTDRAVRLDGQNDFLDYGKYLGSDPACTIAMWIKPENLVGGNQFPAGKWSGDSSGKGWMFRLREADNISAMVGSKFDGPGVFLQAPGAISLVDGVWVHIALTFDGDTFNLYQNGALVRRATGLEFSTDDLVTPMVLGYRSITSTEFFGGVIDEVRIYDYALTPDAIKAIYAADGGDPWVTCTAGIASDLTGDCRVDLRDYALLTGDWQQAYTVNDLSLMATNWLDCDDLDLANCQ